MNGKHAKSDRILDLYERLCDGKVISKAEEARRYGIDQRSIQRDIDDIRAFLDNRAVSAGDRRQIVYDRKKKGFLLRGSQSPLMTNSEILAVSKILLESRAFTKQELSSILDKLISGCVPQKNMKPVSDLLANEKFHYVELTHPSGNQDKLWDIGSSIQQRSLMEITYHRQGSDSPDVTRVVEPVSILFSEYYFYLNAYIVEENDAGHYIHKYDYPAIFRIDRISSYTLRPEKFHLPYANRFQEGEFRKRIQFMYPGRLQQIRFRYSGASVEAVLDRLPTAKIQAQESSGYVIDAEVYGKGILMWLLSQGSSVEVLSPQTMRREMKQLLLEILEKYGKAPVPPPGSVLAPAS